MNLLQIVTPIIFDNTPSGPWTNDDTMIAVSTLITFLVLYVIFALIDKFNGGTWADSFGFEEGNICKIIFGITFFTLTIMGLIGLMIYGVYSLLT